MSTVDLEEPAHRPSLLIPCGGIIAVLMAGLLILKLELLPPAETTLFVVVFEVLVIASLRKPLARALGIRAREQTMWLRGVLREVMQTSLWLVRHSEAKDFHGRVNESVQGARVPLHMVSLPTDVVLQRRFRRAQKRFSSALADLAGLAGVKREAGHILGDLSDAYTAETARNLQARTVTVSFVGYAELVMALIKSVASQYQSQNIVCYTTLSMLIPNWFNYRIQQRESFWFIEIDEQWETYTKMIRTLAQQSNRAPTGLTTGSQQIIMKRCAIVIDDKFAEDKEQRWPHLAFHTAGRYYEWANASILVPASGGQPEWQRLHPFTTEQLHRLFRLPEVGQKIEQLYRHSRSAYVLHPWDSGRLNQSFRYPGYTWCPAWRAFGHLYHSGTWYENCRIWTIEDLELLQTLFLDDDTRTLPEDFFMVGVQNGNGQSAPRWIACLAADVGTIIDQVSLEIVMPELDNSRFEQISSFLDSHISRALILPEWMAQYRRRLGLASTAAARRPPEI